MYKHILVPLDGATLSELAAAHAVRLAKVLGSRISLLHVISRFDSDTDHAVPLLASTAKEAFQLSAIGEAEAILSAGARLGRAHGVAMEGYFVFARNPYEAIIEEARARHCELIVMASHGRRGLEALLLGSETQKVLTHCQIPVLVVRG